MVFTHTERIYDFVFNVNENMMKPKSLYYEVVQQQYSQPSGLYGQLPSLTPQLYGSRLRQSHLQ